MDDQNKPEMLQTSPINIIEIIGLVTKVIRFKS